MGKGGTNLDIKTYSQNEAMNEIWVYLEREGEDALPVSLEILSKARTLADGSNWLLCALILGTHPESLETQARTLGADEIWILDDQQFDWFDNEVYTTAISQVVLSRKPSILLFGATPNGRDLAGRLAVRLRTGLNADCTQLHLDPERGVLVSEVTGFGGGILADLEIPTHRPQMATVRPGVFQRGDQPQLREVVVHTPSVKVPNKCKRTSLLERAFGEGVDLTQASVLVCGGRGMEGRFDLLEELADLVEGEVGGTRPPVDDGYLPRERQIGQTGVICRPKVAVNFGISGAFHYVVGIQDSDIVISINQDPDAPIFEHSDYCLHMDVHHLLPYLIEAFRENESHG